MLSFNGSAVSQELAVEVKESKTYFHCILPACIFAFPDLLESFTTQHFSPRKYLPSQNKQSCMAVSRPLVTQPYFQPRTIHYLGPH
ncbi:hypothetical protein SLA2020_229010 [Shorea laevis]